MTFVGNHDVTRIAIRLDNTRIRTTRWSSC